MKSEDIDEAILASLKKLGPSAPRRIADDAGIDPAKVTYAGTRLRKARLIKTAGATLNLVWALPEQKIEMPSAPPRKAKKAKKAKSARKPDRKSSAVGRAAANARRANGASIRVAAESLDAQIRAKLDAEFAARLAAEGTPLGKLRIALDEYMAVLTDMRQKLVGAEVPPPRQAAVLLKVA